jgi:hypothetical protein
MRKISMFAAALTRHAPTTPGRTALVGHWRKNEQTGRLECHWSLEPVSDEAPACPSARCAQDIGAQGKAAELSDLSLQTAA